MFFFNLRRACIEMYTSTTTVVPVQLSLVDVINQSYINDFGFSDNPNREKAWKLRLVVVLSV